MINRLRASLLALVLFMTAVVAVPAHAGGGSKLEKAWEAFSVNDLSKAEGLFKSAIKSKENPAEAALGLSYTYSGMENTKEAAKAFDTFLEHADNPYPYILALFTSEVSGIKYGGKNNARAISLLEKLTTDEKAPGQLKAMAYSALARHYMQVNELSKAEEHFNKIGSVTEWQLAGTFENISASGFDSNYAPITNPEPDAEFVNKNGAPVKWYNLPGTYNRWVDLTYHYIYGNSVIFAQTFAQSPEDTDIQFRIGTSGSVRVWINDELIITEEKELNNDLDTYVVNTHLKKGTNRILVQVGESELDAMNFMVRITDTNGQPREDINFTTEYAAYPKGAGVKAETVANATETYFYDKIKAEPNNLLNYLILNEFLHHNGKAQDARSLLTKALDIAPQSSCVYLGLLNANNTLDNNTATGTIVEKLKTLPGASNYSLHVQINEAFENKEIEEAEGLIAKLEQTFHDDVTLLMYKIRLASANQNIEELVRLGNEGYEKYPDNYALLNMKYAIIKEMEGDTDRAIKLLSDYEEKNYSYKAITSLSDYYFEIGDAEKGFAYLDKLVEVNPIASGHYSTISSKYLGKTNYDKALEYAEKSLEVAPYISSTYSKIGKIYEEKGKKKQAISYYEKALVYDPTEYEVRRRLRKLKGEKEDMFSRFDDPDVDALLAKAPKAEAYPEDNSLILLDEVNKIVYDGGASEEKHHLVVKVFNSAGIDSWKEYYVPYFNNENFQIEKAEVIKQDGSRVKAETRGNHVVFTALEEGDGIYLSFRKKMYFFGGIKGHFWDQHYFSLFYPSKVSRYRLLTHNTIKFNYEVKNSSLKPEVKKDGDFMQYTWEKKDNPAVYYEDYMPVLTDVGEVLHVSSLPSWDYIAQWYERLSRTKAKTDPEVKEVVAGLWEKGAPLSDTDKAKKIYDYIVKNIRYSSISFRQSGLIPQKASDVLNTKIGDCKDVSTLFVAMCKEAGLNADLVLVNTRDNGRYDLVLPSINFNHCIAKVNLEDEDYYVELTSDYLPFSSVHYSLRNSFVLEIDKYRKKEENKEPMFLNPENKKKNIVNRETHITFNGNDMNLVVKSLKTGDYGTWMRESYRDIGTEQQEKRMLESVGNSLSGVELKKLVFDDNLYSTSDTVSYMTEYSASNALTKLSSLLLFRVPYNEKQLPVDFLSDNSRKYPVDFWQYWAYDETNEVLEVELPEDKKLLEVPENQVIKCAVAEYSLTFEQKGNILVIKRYMKINKDLMPIEELSDTRAFFEQVVQADDMQIAFK